MITCGFKKSENLEISTTVVYTSIYYYYKIKNILGKQNLHKDTLLIAAKEIESHQKDTKKLIPLQNQIKRMKESLYCWFAENFYDDIMKTLTKKSLGVDKVTLKSVMFC